MWGSGKGETSPTIGVKSVYFLVSREKGRVGAESRTYSSTRKSTSVFTLLLDRVILWIWDVFFDCDLEPQAPLLTGPLSFYFCLCLVRLYFSWPVYLLSWWLRTTGSHVLCCPVIEEEVSRTALPIPQGVCWGWDTHSGFFSSRVSCHNHEFVSCSLRPLPIAGLEALALWRSFCYSRTSDEPLYFPYKVSTNWSDLWPLSFGVSEYHVYRTLLVKEITREDPMSLDSWQGHIEKDHAGWW